MNFPQEDTNQNIFETQFDNFSQNVNSRSVRISSVLKPALITLDFQGKLQKFKLFIKSKTKTEPIQKLILKTCSIQSIQKVFSKSKSKSNKYSFTKKSKDEQHQNIHLQIFNWRILFPSLQELELDNNYIKIIHLQTIKQLTNLKTLSICKNLIQTFPSFTQNPNLIKVKARMNPIKQVMLSPFQFYIKQIDIDWLDFISLKRIENSRVLSDNRKKLQKIQNCELSQQFINVIQNLKRQKYTEEANIQECEYPVYFDEFLSMYFNIKNFPAQIYTQFIAQNLRMAIKMQFHPFIDYCVKILDKVNLTTLRCKGTLLIEYALRYSFESVISLLTTQIQHYLEDSLILYQTMLLACKFSHNKLFGFLVNLIKDQQSKAIKQSSDFYQINTSEIEKSKYNEITFQMEQVFHDIQQAKEIKQNKKFNKKVVDKLSPQKQPLLSVAKLQKLLIKALLNFKVSHGSHKILGLIAKLSKIIYQPKKKLKKEQTKNLNQIPEENFKASIVNELILEKKPLQMDQNQKQIIHFQFSEEDSQCFSIEIQMPASCQLKSLTKEQLQCFADGILYISKNPRLSQHFKLKQQIPYQKQKNLIYISGLIRNNELLLTLLWDYKFCVWNRNLLGRIPRTGKVLVPNRKILYVREIQNLEQSFKLSLSKSPHLSAISYKNIPSDSKSIYRVDYRISQRKINYLKDPFSKTHPNQAGQPEEFKLLKVYGQSAFVKDKNLNQEPKVSSFIDSNLKADFSQPSCNINLIDSQMNNYQKFYQSLEEQVVSLNDQNDESLKINWQYELIHEFQWLGYFQSYLNKSEQNFTKLNIQNINRLKKQTSNSSLLKNIAKNIFSCSCVSFQHQQEHLYIVDKNL